MALVDNCKIFSLARRRLCLREKEAWSVIAENEGFENGAHGIVDLNLK